MKLEDLPYDKEDLQLSKEDLQKKYSGTSSHPAHTLEFWSASPNKITHPDYWDWVLLRLATDKEFFNEPA